MWLFVSSLFHLACFQGSFVLQHVLALHYILWLNNNPLCRYTTFCLPVLQLVDIWVVSTFLAIMNNAGLNINVHILVWTYIFQFFWVYAKEWKHPNAHNNSMFNLLENHQTVFQRNCTIFPPAKYQGPSISISLSTSMFFYYSYPKAVQWHLTVVLIYISLMTRQHIEKQRHYFANKGPSSQGYGFSSGRVWM